MEEIVDFIERLFGFAPDNGDGSTEILWLVVLALLVATVVYFRVQRRRQR
jgi:cytochrome c-type biogenesis protein CcmH/NrfF